MKITTLHKYKTKLLKLKLLKTKVYKSQKNFNHLLLKDMETRLKKVLHIIYRFHAANKKILFIGTPIELNNQIKRLLKNKKHSFIPESVWINGIVTNSGPSFKHLIKRHAINSDKTSKFLFNLKNQANLIVILNERFNLTALEESSLKRIPTVSLNANYNLSDLTLSSYKVPGDYGFTKRKIRNNLFFLLLNSLLKKAEIVRKRQIEINTKRRKLKLVQKTWNKNKYKKNVYQKKK